MAKEIRTAVIGTGYLGRFHAQKYAELSNSKLVGIVDIDKARAEANPPTAIGVVAISAPPVIITSASP